MHSGDHPGCDEGRGEEQVDRHPVLLETLKQLRVSEFGKEGLRRRTVLVDGGEDEEAGQQQHGIAACGAHRELVGHAEDVDDVGHDKHG
eukprot:scaffold424_cov69-Phaeocystis_antarctica.AAC.18